MAPKKIAVATAVLAIALLGLSAKALTAVSGFELAGLALHQETGRDIYLGGIYLEAGTAANAATLGTVEPRIMEYRVVARRTSIRSLLGGMLLQSEVATQQTPDTATTAFANQILTTVRGSLYAGDSFEIRLDAGGITSAYLNNQQLAVAADPAVAQYFTMGWIAERGPSTTFREGLLASSIDPTLMAELEGQQYSEARGNEIAAWFTAPAAPPTQPQPQPQPQPSTDTSEPVADKHIAMDDAINVQEDVVPPQEAAPAEVTEVVVSQAAVIAAVPPQAPISDVVTSLPEPPEQIAATPVEEAIQVASLTPMTSMVTETEALEAFDIKEYSRRVSVFHKQLVAMVYGEITYPRRAVRREMQGRMELDITLSDSGKLIGVDIVQSSGHKILDEAGLSAAQEALGENKLEQVDPLAATEFRSEITDGQLVVPVPIMFMLTK